MRFRSAHHQFISRGWLLAGAFGGSRLLNALPLYTYFLLQKPKCVVCGHDPTTNF